MHKVLCFLDKHRSKYDWFLTYLVVCIIHVIFIRFYAKSFNLHNILRHPIKIIPSYLFFGWDSAWYKNLFYKYDSLIFPPMYPLTLRLIAFLFQFKQMAFEKSAVILNFVSHILIVNGLYLYCKKLSGKQVQAWIVVLILFFYPGHNVFFAAYSDSFFLAVTIFVFVLRQNNKLLLSSILAGFACLIRTFAMFLCFALIAEQIFLSIKDKKIRVKELMLVSPGFLIFLFWNLYIYLITHNNITALYEKWTADLLSYHIPAGTNPQWWSFKYLFISMHKECIYTWFSIIGAIYLGIRKRYLEMFYILLFYFSLAFYIYRPFAFSRYVAAFFPCFLIIAEILRNRPRLQITVLSSFIVISYYFQIRLFLGFLGEP